MLKLLKKTSKALYDVKQTTEILKQYGISHSEKKTRELISKGKLKGDKPIIDGKKADINDRRAGFVIMESDIYSLVISEIPVMEEIFEELKSHRTSTTSSKVSKANKVKDVSEDKE